jgi:hypothetical protein
MQQSGVVLGCHSGAQPGGGSEGGPQLADALLEAATVLLEAAAGPLGSPLRRHLLSAAADVHHCAGRRGFGYTFAGRKSSLPDMLHSHPVVRW